MRGGDEIGRTRAYPLRIAYDGHRALGEHVEQQFHVVDEHRGQRLHAFYGDALGDLVEQLAQFGVLFGEGTRPRADVLGQQEFTAGGAHRPCSATSRERWSATLK